MLFATGTDTTTDTRPAQVTASLQETGDTAALSSSDHVNWSGELWNNRFTRMPDGDYTVGFTADWSNGYRNVYDCRIRILHKIYEVLVTQLRN